MGFENSFKQADYDKVVEFLNFIAEKAEFNKWTTKDSVQHFKLLSYMQNIVLPKINDHILEVEQVIKPQQPKNEGE